MNFSMTRLIFLWPSAFLFLTLIQFASLQISFDLSNWIRYFATASLIIFLIVASIYFPFRKSKTKKIGTWKLILWIYSIILLWKFAGRWDVFPLGGWDAIQMWSYKGFYFSEAQKAGIPFVLHPSAFLYHPEYPALLPLFLSFFYSLTDSFQYWISQSLSYASLVCWSGLFIGLGNYKQGGWKWVRIIFVTSCLSIPLFYSVATDLYADIYLAAFLSIFIGTLLQLNEVDFNPRYRIILTLSGGFALGIIPGLKNEGMVVFVLVFSFLGILLRYPLFQKNKNLLIVGLASAVLPISLKVVGGSFLSSDFGSGSILAQLIAHTNGKDLQLILHSAFHFYWKETYGLFFLATFFIFRSPNKLVVSLGILLVGILFCYTCFFLFTSADLQWHLNTAYSRIHTQILMPYLLLASYSLSGEGIEVEEQTRS